MLNFEWDCFASLAMTDIVGVFETSSGNLPARALGLVVEWASMHQDELRHDWELAKNQQKPEKIKPLK